MKQINSYIIEKLHINKDTKVIDVVTSEKLFKALLKSGEVNLDNIFNYDIEEGHGKKVVGIYAVGNKMYMEVDDGKGIYSDIELWKPSNIFNEKEMQKIYNYLLEF